MSFNEMIARISMVATWRSVLDILVIASLIFFAYHTMRRFGTWKIAVGVLIAAIFFMVSSWLKLEGVMWIYSNLSPIALIALIVIFQPEIRKLFSRVATIRKPGEKPTVDENTQPIVKALIELAAKRQGAIIVFPGKDDLAEWIAGGIVLDAKSSVPLLLSIFDDNSPGHDGAVIVSEGKLTRFGTRLPNSTSMRLSEDFGTRHQASLGLSEVSDALVLTVSEERGSISAFRQGKMTPIKGQADLLSIIADHRDSIGKSLIQSRMKERKGVWIGEIALSLLFSFLIWYSVAAPAGQVVEVDIQPQLLGRPPAGMSLLSVDVFPDTVKVIIKNDSTEIQDLRLTTTPVMLNTLKTGQTIKGKIIAPPDLAPYNKRWPDVDITVTYKDE